MESDDEDDENNQNTDTRDYVSEAGSSIQTLESQHLRTLPYV